MPSADSQSLNIVVVEDHDALRGLICEALSARGHQVTGLTCAEDLPDLMPGGAIDVFLLDLNLPGEDGLSLAKRLRAVHPLVGIVMATARTSTTDRIAGYEQGADIYLPKPFEVEELLAAIEAVGRRHRSQSVIGGISRDTFVLDQIQLKLAGPDNLVVTLTSGEAAMVAAFVRAPGQRLEVWQITEILGKTIESYNKASLEVRLTRLRKKLIEAGAPDNCLESIRREGYQLCMAVHLS